MQHHVIAFAKKRDITADTRDNARRFVPQDVRRGGT
jgi:hypothetical protein